MRLAAIASTVLALLVGEAAHAQLPQTLPANTVVGRLGVGTGPGQAIPFATLASQLSAQLFPGAPVDVVAEFGVVADSASPYDSSHAASNSLALQNALATGKCIYFPANANGYSIASNIVTVSTGQCIANPTQVKVKSQPAAGEFVFKITAFEVTGANAYIDNLIVDTSGAASGSTAFRFGTSTQVIAGAQITRILCLSAFECIGDESSASNYVLDLKLYDIRAELTRGRQIFIRRSRGFMWLDTIRIDQTQSGQPLPANWNCAEFNDLVGLEINRYDCVGPSIAQTTTYQSGAYGLSIQGSGSGQSSVWLNRILVDNTSGNGVNIGSVNFLQTNWVETFQNLGTGVTLTSIGSSQLSNTFAYGAVGLTGAAAAANGFTCSACLSVNATNLISEFNTGQGLSIAGASSGVIINNYQGLNNTLFGIVFTGPAENLLINGGVVSGNGSGPLSDTAVGKNRTIRNIKGFPQFTGIADANYVAIGSDDVVRYSSITASRTVTLPAASLYEQGRVFSIEDASGSASAAVTISAAPNGTDTINGSNTTQVVVNTAYGQSNLESNGSTGWVVRRHAVAGDCVGSDFLGKAASCTIPANTVTDAKFRQGVARSVVGVTGNATANVADIQGAALQIPQVNAAGTALTFTKLLGTNTNDSASAGQVGEYTESNIASGSSVSLTTATAANITSISLTAGDWDVDANCQFAGNATTTVLYQICSLSQTSATLDNTVGRQVGIVYNNVAIYNLIAGGVVSQTIPPLRFSLSGTTTVYLVAQESFGVAAATAFGILRARRVR